MNTEKEKEEHLFELYANLSRIFDSEASLREKVIPFEWSLNFPIMPSEDTSKLCDREENFYPKVYK